MMGTELDELGEFDNEFIDSISKFNVWVWKFHNTEIFLI